MPISTTDLPLNADGSVYHLNLKPGDLGNTIVLVGDPARTALVSQHFDRVEIKKQHREFITHTGTIGKHRLSVIGTGIGPGNIEIVMTEVDALFNVDFATRTVKKDVTSLRFIRLGTSGTVQHDIPVDSYVVSSYALGFDGLLNYYRLRYNDNEKKLLHAVQHHFAEFSMLPAPYVAQAAPELCSLFYDDCRQGITLTANGFYGPQQRNVRAPLSTDTIIECARQFDHHNLLITNIEMESVAIFGLGNLLGHRCCSVNTILANRITNTMSSDSAKTINTMISMGLERLTAS